MNRIEVFKKHKWFKPDTWIVEWNNGKRTFVHGYPKFSNKEFKGLKELLEWVKKNVWWIDTSPGGGYNAGVCLYLDDYVIAEWWFARTGNNEIFERLYIIPGELAMANTGKYPKAEKV